RPSPHRRLCRRRRRRNPLGLSDTSGPLADLIADGFLRLQEGRVAATPAGRPVLDAVLRTLLT
ncbi:MAG TPA: hypothetical protein VLZ73_07775, partial [Brevundimonas sp.]|nr:hypothetical protein [Brevundimonas sp.]